jgi:hypothetical protein
LSEALAAIWLWRSGQMPVMAYLVLWQLFSWGLRSKLRGAIALYVLMFFGLSIAGGVGVISLFVVPTLALLIFALTRLGLLTSVAMLWILHITKFFPLWADPSAWFAGESAVIFLLGALPAVWGAWTAIRGGAAAASL